MWLVLGTLLLALLLVLYYLHRRAKARRDPKGPLLNRRRDEECGFPVGAANRGGPTPTVRTHHMGASAAAPSADARHLAYASGIQGKAGASIDPHLSRVGAPGGRRPGSRKDRGRQELLFSTQI
jgi:hypothetical protein